METKKTIKGVRGDLIECSCGRYMHPVKFDMCFKCFTEKKDKELKKNGS